MVVSHQARSGGICALAREMMTGCAWWRGLGLLLLIAALLKSDPRQVVAAGGLDVLRVPEVLVVVIWAETGLGCWVLAGFHPRATRRLLICCFGLFAIVAGALVWEGSSSCHCFGTAPIPPWIMLVVDLAIVVALYLSPASTGISLTLRSHSRRTVVACVAAILLSIGASSRLEAGLPVSIETALAKTGRAVLLDPNAWVGRVFPLLSVVQWQSNADPSQLLEGDWVVVLHRRGCPACRAVLDALDRADLTASVPRRLALIEFPTAGPEYPEGHEVSTHTGHALFEGRLLNDRAWFGKIPTVLRLREGFVVQIEQNAESRVDWLNTLGVGERGGG